jgi:hypothetical protein
MNDHDDTMGDTITMDAGELVRDGLGEVGAHAARNGDDARLADVMALAGSLVEVTEHRVEVSHDGVSWERYTEADRWDVERLRGWIDAQNADATEHGATIRFRMAERTVVTLTSPWSESKLPRTPGTAEPDWSLTEQGARRMAADVAEVERVQVAAERAADGHTDPPAPTPEGAAALARARVQADADARRARLDATYHP